MKLEFHPEAIGELQFAARYCEGCRPGLAERFIDAVEDAIRRIADTPFAWRLSDHDVRRCLTRVFPYGVFYTVADESVLVVAVGHCARKPGYWKARF
jgi:toxin ParE1/3/4